MSTPSSTITLYGGKAGQLVTDYSHTFFFTSRTAQNSFFNGITEKITITPTQYIRVSDNSIKVNYAKETIMDYCYLSITNIQTNTSGTAVSNTYYAFILNIEYISDKCSLITYKIDSLQTFLLDDNLAFNEIFVERCHDFTDTIGSNRNPEPFDVSELVPVDLDKHSIGKGVILGIKSGETVTIAGTSYQTEGNAYANSVYSDGTYFGFNLGSSTEVAVLKALLDDIIDDNIIMEFFSCPWQCISSNRESGGYKLIPSVAPASYSITHTGTASSGGIDGYTPVNKKLFTYPFTQLQVSNTVGEKISLKFEDFTSASYTFECECSWLGSQEISLHPKYYNNVDGTADINYDYSVKVDNFPMCPFGIDAYKEWNNQKAFSSLLFGGVKALASGLTTGLFTGNAILGAGVIGTSFAGTLAGMTSDAIQASNTPNTVVGTPQGNINAIQNGHYCFVTGKYTIHEHDAILIDKYFTMYGYAQNQLMDVDAWMSHATRTGFKFKYIKTIGCRINAKIPNMYKDEIQKAFDNGITFWNASADIGNYTITT